MAIIESKKTIGVGSGFKYSGGQIHRTEREIKQDKMLKEAIDNMNFRRESRPDKKFEREMERSDFFDTVNESVQNRLKNERTRLQKLNEEADNAEYIKAVREEAIASYFSNLVFESIPMDGETKRLSVDGIYTVAHDFYKNSTVNVTSSPYFRSLDGIVTDYLTTNQIERDRLPEEEVKKITLELVNRDQRRTDLTNMIQSKVMNAVRTEGLLSKYRQVRESKDLWYDKSNTLFRTLVEGNMIDLMEEGVEPELARDKALFVAMTEYATLETAHTTKLINNVDTKALRRNINFAVNAKNKK